MWDLLQWPAMVVTLAASWMVGSNARGRRNGGFWLFLLSNLLWVVWGVWAQAWALVLLQIGLSAMNLRGAVKTDAADAA